MVLLVPGAPAHLRDQCMNRRASSRKNAVILSLPKFVWGIPSGFPSKLWDPGQSCRAVRLGQSISLILDPSLSMDLGTAFVA